MRHGNNAHCSRRGTSGGAWYDERPNEPCPRHRRRPGRAVRRHRADRGGARRHRCWKPARPPAAAAARISIANWACASTTATTCCCPAIARHSLISTRSARGDTLAGPANAAVPVHRPGDAAMRWTLRPNLGRIPWWMLSRGRRVPGTRAMRLPRAAAPARLKGDATWRLACARQLYRRLIEPLAIAALNTPPESVWRACSAR